MTWKVRTPSDTRTERHGPEATPAFFLDERYSIMRGQPPKISPSEKWREIPGYEGRYMVSTHGRLYSVPRRIEKVHPKYGTKFSVWWKGGVKKLRPDSYGYPCAYFGRLKGPLHNGIQIHVAVALTFIGPNPGGLDVRHLDDDIKNNHYKNLGYGTRTRNILDARKSGKPWKIFTIEEAREIRYLVNCGISKSDIARACSVSPSSISAIVEYRSLREEKDYA